MAFSFGRKKTTVGLDIGSGLIKVAVIDHSKKNAPELVRAAIAPLAQDAIVEGEVMDPGIVAEAIRTAMSNAGVTTREVVIAVGGRDVIVKKIQIERVKEQQVRELLRWEAEQHVPFDVESVELDHQTLDPQGTGPQMDVLLVAAKRELIQAKQRVLDEAGLTAVIVDVESFALHNGFEVNHPDAMSGIVGLLNIGHDVTNINILEDGVPILSRDIAVGTRRLREDMMRERGLGADESDRLLQGFDRSPHLDAVIETRGEEIAVGVERAVAFMQQSNRSAEIRQIYSCGGGARIPGLNQMLGGRLRIAVEQANPLANLKVRDGALESLVTDEVSPLLMLPIGLALRQVA
ncbi:MAG TPA: type IV pilus assembly protein PilM [Gemmatimonadaceae bacterium]|nr:type IV pilus assembly protein PilM [Gemmatimonadaceae bacterium]